MTWTNNSFSTTDNTLVRDLLCSPKLSVSPRSSVTIVCNSNGSSTAVCPIVSKSSVMESVAKELVHTSVWPHTCRFRFFFTTPLVCSFLSPFPFAWCHLSFLTVSLFRLPPQSFRLCLIVRMSVSISKNYSLSFFRVMTYITFPKQDHHHHSSVIIFVLRDGCFSCLWIVSSFLVNRTWKQKLNLKIDNNNLIPGLYYYFRDFCDSLFWWSKSLGSSFVKGSRWAMMREPKSSTFLLRKKKRMTTDCLIARQKV